MASLVAQVLGIAHSLDRAGIEWALGGALALAYATEEPRGTRDIDVNVFVSASEVRRVFVALPDGVTTSTSDEARVLAEDQVRLWWDGTPIDLFFAAAPFHAEVANRIRRVPFAGHTVEVEPCDERLPAVALLPRQITNRSRAAATAASRPSTPSRR